VKALLIPVKELGRAKQRLAPLLSQAERTALAQVMMEDVFSAISASQLADQVFLVSSYEPALEKARGLGWQVIWEHRQISESESVDYASRVCAERGVASLLRLPIDVPLVRPEDIDALFERAQDAPSAVIVPSQSGGTNALLRTPPTLFPSHFGPDSLARHIGEARSRKAPYEIVRSERLELDIDDAEDLAQLCARVPATGATGRWLAQAGYGPDWTAGEKRNPLG
jgi:2-phospho-L-lactate/phosphoenolpyruvate guanylyltransferase